ncbi:ferredoxin-NADP+ reductase subunit alpha [Geomonas sp. Red276]
MFQVISNEILAENLHKMVVSAPLIARARKPGQFVIVRLAPGEERIPLTIGDADAEKGTITLFVQAVGASTLNIVHTAPGGFLRDVAGPLGMPTEIRSWGRVACVGGGVGTAVLFPLVKALAAAGNRITTIIGGRSERFIILADELRPLSETLLITTEDGSLGERGLVTAALTGLIADPGQRPDAVFAVGPVPMMKAVAEVTRPYRIETIASLNPIMIDGTGMCGGCRVRVGNETKFACVDGPEFDAHLVDFDSLGDRLRCYRDQEAASLAAAKCKLSQEVQS